MSGCEFAKILLKGRQLIMTFDDLFSFAGKHSPSFAGVQEYQELQHIFNLIQGCESYLEIGTAEGCSMYVLAHALKEGAKITSVDLGERHTIPYKSEVVKILSPKYDIGIFHGDSMDKMTYPNKKPHDVVLIDGGHDYDTVLSDANMYGGLATKYLLFHDVKLPEVKRVIVKYLENRTEKYYEFINSDNFGFGILEVCNG